MMEQGIKGVAIFCLIISSAAISLHAKPAAPTLISHRQPDGTSISIRLFGNEHFHYSTSEDGYLLLPGKNGALYFAGDDADTSSHPAKNINARSADDIRFLGKLNAGKTIARYKASQGDLLQKASSNSSVLKLPATSTVAGEDSIRGLVILVQFPDVAFSLSDPQSEYTRYMNEEGFSDYGMAGSVRDFYRENSNGKFVPHFDVYGPVTLAHTSGYYGANTSSGGTDARVGTMIISAVQALDSAIDYSLYDNDGDGYVDFVYVIYAGLGEADGGADSTIWPQAGYVSATGYRTKDGTRVKAFATSNEVSGSAAQAGIYALDGIGSIVHEFGHVLGLLDIYATATTTNVTPGYWDVMDIGVYDCLTDVRYYNQSCTPPNFSAFERMSLGWLSPDTLKEENGVSPSLPTIASNKAFVIANDENEFFLLENRQLENFDAALPGHGLLIWHIDYSETAWSENTINDTDGHPRVDIERADGAATAAGDAGDAFPGTDNITRFSGFITWDSTILAPALYNIKESNGIVCFATDASTNVACDATTGGIVTTDISRNFMFLAGRTLHIHANEAATLRVFDIHGKALKDAAIPAGDFSMNIAGYNGVIIAELFSKGKIIARRSLTMIGGK